MHILHVQPLSSVHSSFVFVAVVCVGSGVVAVSIVSAHDVVEVVGGCSKNC